jgi:hypothetical protein
MWCVWGLWPEYTHFCPPPPPPTDQSRVGFLALQPIFLGLLDEALALHSSHGFYRTFPVLPVVLGSKALLAHRLGDSETMLDCAIAALAAAK